MDKSIFNQLKRFAQVFKEAKERNANESDTVMLLVEFFKEVLGYDPLKGEISKEVAIKSRYCDFAVKLDGEIKLLVEAKRVGEAYLATAKLSAERRGRDQSAPERSSGSAGHGSSDRRFESGA